MKKLKLKITAPWGVVDINGYLDNIRYCKKQTQYSLDVGTANDREVARQDIEAYDTILDTNSEDMAFVFMREKELMKKQGNRYKGGMSVILRMQAKNMMSP